METICNCCDLPKTDFRSYKGKQNKFCNACLSKHYKPEHKYKKLRLGHICAGCNRAEPTVQFRIRKGRVNLRCNNCNGASTAYKKRNWDKTLAKRAEWLKTGNGIKYQKTSDKKKWRINKYGITNEIFHSLKDAQNGCCAICQTPSEKLCVDHDHETGMVRSLLCKSCNSGLGFFVDKIENLEKAVEYLKYWKTWSYR